MRAGSPNQFSTTDPLSSSQPEHKSLFRNILAVSPYTSIFYPYPARPAPSNFLRMNILGIRRGKNIESISTQDFRPGLIYAAPSGAELGAASTTGTFQDFGGNEKQVPPLRRRIRSGSGRNDKDSPVTRTSTLRGTR
jgi:hypothetical protein